MDVWAIDAYPINWTAPFPNSAEFHAPIVKQQLQRMRAYLDTVQDSAGELVYFDTPIWITEIAIHVGYDEFDVDPITRRITIPDTSDYHWDEMGEYLIEILDWLEDNAAGQLIEKWFFFTTWKDIVDVGPDGYMGIIFFDGPEHGASLNCLGDIYRARSLDLGHVKCDADGNTVPDP